MLVLKAIGAAPSAAATGSLNAGTTMGIGSYVYVYTYANADGESKISPTFSISTTSGNQKVALTGITVGSTGTTKRNIYRTVVGGGTTYKFVAALNDNTTTTYTDSVADGSLGATVANTPTFGGAIILQDSTGAVTFKINNDGSFSAANFPNTTITGTLTVSGLSTLHDIITSTGKIGKVTAGDVLDFSGGTDTTIKAISGRIKHSQGTDVTGTFTVSSSSTFSGAVSATSGMTVSGGTLTTGAITASGVITSSAGFNITGGTLSGLTNGFSRINAVNITATTTTTFFNHGLGAQPDWIAFKINGTSTSPHNIYINTVNSTQLQVTSDGSLGCDILSGKY